VLGRQSSAVDRSRAPPGQAVLWVQVRAQPSQIRRDAAGEIDAREWADAAEPYAERVMAKLSEYAPGIKRLVLKRGILTPATLRPTTPTSSAATAWPAAITYARISSFARSPVTHALPDAG
jgi:phytoene dehydrogenase-like protein